MDIADLTFTPVHVDGRQSNWLLSSDGSLLPHIRGGNGEGDPPAGDPTGDPPAGDPPAGDPPAEDPPDPKAAAKVEMTQAELDAMIQKRVEKATKNAQDEAKKAADRAKLDEAERLKAEKADADRERDEAKREALAVRVETTATKSALTAKVDPAKVDRFLKLADLDDLESLTDDGKPDGKAIDKLIAATLKDWPEFLLGDGTKGGKSGGQHNGHAGADKPKNLADAIDQHYANA